MEVSLVLSSRVGDYTGVLPLMGQHGIFYVKKGTFFLNPSMNISNEQLKKRAPCYNFSLFLPTTLLGLYYNNTLQHILFYLFHVDIS